MTNTTNNTNTTTRTPEFLSTAVQKKDTAKALKEKATALAADFKKEGPVKAVKKNLRSIIAILLAVIVVLSILSFLGGLGYKSAVKKSIECYIGKRTLYTMNTMPNCVWKEYADDMGKTALELKIASIGEAAENKEEMKNAYDKISYEMDDFDDLSKRKVKEMKDMIADNYASIDEKDIGNKMYETTVTLEYECDGEDYEEEGEILAVKINGDWYAVNPYGYFLSIA